MKHKYHRRRAQTKNRHESPRARVRSVWHLPFATFLRDSAPNGFHIDVEVWLSLEPSRADIIILRRGVAPDAQGAALHRLWPLLRAVTVLEYKSPIPSSYRRGDLIRLISYGALYHSQHAKDLSSSDELTLVLVVASLTPTLRDEVKRMGWDLVTLSQGYLRVRGVMYRCFIVVLDDVCQEEKSELLRTFSHHPVSDPEVRAWMAYWMKERKMNRIRRPTREEVDLIMRDLVKRLPANERLEGLAPKKLIEHIPEHKLVVNLPLEMLRALSPEYVQSLPEDVQLKIQKRLDHDTPAPKSSKPRMSKQTKTVAPPTNRRSRKAA